MAIYHSQFREFFSGLEDCIATLMAYGNRIEGGAGLVEHYWMVQTLD